jgi:hypothetical protein
MPRLQSTQCRIIDCRTDVAGSINTAIAYTFESHTHHKVEDFGCTNTDTSESLNGANVWLRHLSGPDLCSFSVDRKPMWMDVTRLPGTLSASFRDFSHALAPSEKPDSPSESEPRPGRGAPENQLRPMEIPGIGKSNPVPAQTSTGISTGQGPSSFLADVNKSPPEATRII